MGVVLLSAFVFNFTALSAVVVMMPILVAVQFVRYPAQIKLIIGETANNMKTIADDILIIRKDGTLVVTKVDSKKFVGVDILYAGVYRKGDDRTIYNLIYRDGLKGASFIKRFAVGGVTRDKEYPLTQGNKGSLIHYLSVNPNGEAETVSINLRAVSRLKKLKWDIDFAKMSIRSLTTSGNKVTKETIKRVELKAKGISTLDA